MILIPILVYTIIYVLGYCVAYWLNLLTRRLLISDPRLAGLGLVAIAAMAAAYLIDFSAAPDDSPLSVGQRQGELALVPPLVVFFTVGIRMWLQNRKPGKLRKPSE